MSGSSEFESRVSKIVGIYEQREGESEDTTTGVRLTQYGFGAAPPVSSSRP
jgi:hypothetical protein